MVSVSPLEGEAILVSVADPLNLVLQCRLENESRQDVGYGLHGHLATLCARGFTPKVVYTDLHSTFKAMMLDSPGVKINVCGAGDMYPKWMQKWVPAKSHIMRIKRFIVVYVKTQN
jgi:hypothetical protein